MKSTPSPLRVPSGPLAVHSYCKWSQLSIHITSNPDGSTCDSMLWRIESTLSLHRVRLRPFVPEASSSKPVRLNNNVAPFGPHKKFLATARANENPPDPQKRKEIIPVTGQSPEYCCLRGLWLPNCLKKFLLQPRLGQRGPSTMLW